MKSVRIIRNVILFGLITTATVAVLAAEPGDWPGWRGMNRDGRSSETGLLKQWPQTGPKLLWQVDAAGVGYSTVAVSDGRIITQGDIDGIEHIIAFDESNGSILWAVQPEPVKKSLDERLTKQFLRLDRNGDGKLDELEAINGLGRDAGRADSVGKGDKVEIARNRAAGLMKQLDQDGNGKLISSEVPRAMQNDFSRMDGVDRNIDATVLATKRTKTLLESADKDGDAKVTRQESRVNLLGRLFNRIDQRKPGERRGDGQLTEEEIQSYFLTRERGRDGEITIEELQQYYERTYPGRDGVLTKDDVSRYYGGFRNNQGDGPRGTPTVDENRIYVEGGNGDVTCLDAETGRTLWHLNLVTDLGGGRPGWGYSESPLVDGENLIVTPGGNRGAVAALNKLTGELVWRSEDVTDRAHYSSAITAGVHGVHQIIQFTRERVVGLDAGNGKLLWDYSNSANGTANACTPIYSDGHVFSSSGYGTGGGLVKLTRSEDEFQAEEVYFEKSMANHHGGIVLVDGYLYGFGGNTLICMDFKTGELAWRSRSVGKGSLVFADGNLYCLGERNMLGLVESKPERYSEKGRFSIPKSGRPSWAHPVIANGKLYIRDQGMLTCYDIRAKQ